MADWNEPTLSTAYATFLSVLKDRGVDCAKMDFSAATNIPVGTVQYVAASNKFQTWSGSAWVDIVLSVAGGGTGGTAALGSIATQPSDDVFISGGIIEGTEISGNVMLTSVMVTHSVDQTFAQGSNFYPAFNGDQYDSWEMHDVVTNNSRITIPTGQGGLYLVGGSVDLATTGNITKASLAVESGGSLIRGYDERTVPTATVAHLVLPPTVMGLSAADYIRLRVYCDGSGTATVKKLAAYSPYFWAVRVSQN